MFLALCIGLCPFVGHSANTEILPDVLQGEWERPASNEHGNISIVITEKEGNTIKGVMTLTGSSYCKDPIPFRGSGSGNTAHIIGDAPIVCGYRGTLKGQVTRQSSALYTGNFSYRWFGITWASGTFKLIPNTSFETNSTE